MTAHSPAAPALTGLPAYERPAGTHPVLDYPGYRISLQGDDETVFFDI